MAGKHRKEDSPEVKALIAKHERQKGGTVSGKDDKDRGGRDSRLRTIGDVNKTK